MTKYDHEPIPGLPGVPPPGELILWQGVPDWLVLARTAFHTRLVGGYFAALTGWAFLTDLRGAAMTAMAGIAGVGLLHVLAWATARATRYTLTNKRIVLRIGVALPKCINLPLAMVGTVGLATHADGSGDLPVALTDERRLGYVALWPHARPWHVTTPQPMLRAVPHAADVAALIARTCLATQPYGRIERVAAPMPVSGFGEAVAA